MIEIIEDEQHSDEYIQESEKLLGDIQRLCERQFVQKVRSDLSLRLTSGCTRRLTPYLFLSPLSFTHPALLCNLALSQTDLVGCMP